MDFVWPLCSFRETRFVPWLLPFNRPEGPVEQMATCYNGKRSIWHLGKKSICKGSTGKRNLKKGSMGELKFLARSRGTNRDGGQGIKLRSLGEVAQELLSKQLSRERQACCG